MPLRVNAADIAIDRVALLLGWPGTLTLGGADTSSGTALHAARGEVNQAIAFIVPDISLLQLCVPGTR